MAIRNLPSWSCSQTIPSDRSIGSRLVDDLLKAMTERDWSATELFHVQLAYEEAVVNAIIHGNGGARDKTVQIEMICDNQRVRIQITDQGQGFDPSQVPDPRADDRLEVPGGRGLLLMSEIMSDVTYNATGNQVTLTSLKATP